jgi:MATE family multidrug resistance protein
MSQNTFFHAIKREIQSTLSISIPLVASQLVYACSGFLGTAMVAHLGEDALAASVLVSMIWMSMSVLFFGILNSVSILVSHQFGANNDKAISEIMGQAMILGVITTIVMILLLCTMPYFLNFTTQPKHVIELSISYMHALLWTIPGLITLIICENFLAGANRSRLVLRISLLVVPIEVPIIYILIFGKFGLPACGVAGIGYGFATTYTLVAICLSYYLAKSKSFERFGVFKSITLANWHRLKELIRVGFPMGCMHVIEVSTFAIATFWVARFGTTMLAAHQIVMQYLSFVITMVFAMSQAVTVRVGHEVGRQSTAGIQYAIYVGMLLNFVCVIFVALAFYLLPTLFLRLDMNIYDPANLMLIKDSSSLLAIAGVLIIFDNFRIIGFGALRGLKDTKFPMYASFISFWIVGLAFTYLFGCYYGYAGQGIWWGLTLGIACGATIVLTRVQWLVNRIDVKKIMGK